MDIVFGTKWFETHQRKLLWLLNTPIIKYWFRWIMRIHSFDCKRNIVINKITPNSISYNAKIINDKIEVTTDFRTHDKYSKRLYYAFKPFWYLLHIIDWVAFDRYEELTKLSFGFSTLTVYPDSGSGGTTTCSYVGREGVSESWATIIAGAGTGAAVVNYTDACYLSCSTSSAKFKGVRRTIFTFDTSSLTSDATISAAILSSYGSSKTDNTSSTPNVDIYTTTPASNNTIVAADYLQFGSTSQTGSPITYANWSVGSYNDFTFNATGRGNISKTGISKFGTRNANYDVAGSQPNWVNNQSSYLSGTSSEPAGTSTDPKLVVTYTSPSTANFFNFM